MKSNICNPFFRNVLPLVLVFLFSINAITARTYKSNIDSLRYLLKTEQEDTSKAIYSYKLCWEYIRKGLFDSALYYGNSALELSEKTNFKKGIIGAYGNMGNAFYAQSNYPQALEYYFKTLKVAEEEGDQKNVVRWLGNIGVVYTRMGDYIKAIDYYFRILYISEKLNDKKSIATAYNNIGIIYKFKGNYRRALDYFSKALRASEDLQDNYLVANNLGNLGVIYENLKQYEKALSYYSRVLKIANQLGEKRIIAGTYDNMGNVYTTQKKYDQALDYYFKALKIDEELGNKNGIAIKLGNIGALYTEMKQYQEAETYLQKSLKIAEEIQSLNDIKAANEYLSELYTQVGNHEKALVHYKDFSVAQDSILSEQKNEAIAQKEMSYEFSKKEMAAKAQQERLILEQETEKKKTQVIVWSIAGGLLLAIIFAAFIFRSLRITKKQKEVIESQKEKTEQLQETLKSDLSHYMLLSFKKLMNPHFIFNSLNSIQSFILQNDKLKANIYLSKFSGLIRKVLEQSQMEYITLNDELETLAMYIDLEAQRFVGKFTSAIEIDPTIETKNYLIPPLIFQPFVENAILHGLMHKDEEGKLTITVKMANNRLLCTVEDNGVGREASMKINKDRKDRESFGIKATNQRIKILNSLNNSDIGVAYTDLKDSNGNASGTRVTFSLPVLTEKDIVKG